MYFLLLPFSNLEVNCCFGQHCYSHNGWPDCIVQMGLVHLSTAGDISFFFVGHMLLTDLGYKALESPSDPLWKKPSLGIMHIGVRKLSLLINCSLPVLKLQVFEGMQNRNIWQSLSLMYCHYNHCESDKACQPSKPKCHAGCESWVWDG